MKALERRIERLERGTRTDAEIEHARAVLAAWERVRDHPEMATDADRKLGEGWQHAFVVLINATGGFGAAVRASMELRKANRE